MKTIFLSVLLALSFSLHSLHSQNEPDDKEKAKSGWSFGAVPAIAYDSDIGFKYGGVVNFYDYGDGSVYPMYKHSIYLEWSRTTKGSGINQFTYDSKYLIPGVRTSAEVSLLTEKALDFYGFNGYEAYYNSDFENDELPEDAYISRMFYRNERRLLRIRADFQGAIIKNKLNWFAGFAHYGNRLDTVDITSLNEGKEQNEMLPPVNGGLFGNYIRWGLLPEDQVDGGNTNLLKLGLVYDTRDNEPNPMKGIWTEMQLLLAPSFLGNGDLGYSRFAITHRQYFTLVPKTVNLAYRLSYQAKLSGTMPFYMLPFVFNTAPQMTRDGLGGAKTLRGILRNRVVGEDFAYGNIELRWKVLRTVVLNQNFYIALAGFVDGGMVTGKYELQDPYPEYADEANAWLALGDKESLHLSYGAGVHFAINENFIVTVDYGIAADPRDGNSGLYIGLNFLF
jgi:outer membrane protein assembly factor BamA